LRTDRIKAHFVGQFTRSEPGMVSYGAFLQSKSLQPIYLVVTTGLSFLLLPASRVTGRLAVDTTGLTVGPHAGQGLGLDLVIEAGSVVQYSYAIHHGQ
jgi:hypothetical protein